MNKFIHSANEWQSLLLLSFALNICIPSFCVNNFFFCSLEWLRVTLLDWIVSVTLIYKKLQHCLLKWLYHFIFPPALNQRHYWLLLCILAKSWCFHVKRSSWICMWWFSHKLWLASPWWLMILNSFSCYLLKSFLPLFNLGCCFLTIEIFLYFIIYCESNFIYLIYTGLFLLLLSLLSYLQILGINMLAVV